MRSFVMSIAAPASPIAGRRQAVLALGGCLLGAGCASYTPTETALPAAPAAAAVAAVAEQAQGGVALLVEPVSDPQRQRALFGGELNPVGLLAMVVSVRNRGTTTLPLRAADFFLEPPGGAALRATPPALAADRLRATESTAGAGIAGAAFFGVFGALAATAAATSANQEAADARRLDFERKGLPEVELPPGQEQRGVLFFVPPDGTPAFDAAVLAFRPRSGALPISVGLSGLGYRPAR
jgi:hypothetical protein